MGLTKRYSQTPAIVRAGLLVAAVILAGCASTGTQQASSPTGDYTYAKDYLSWLVETNMRKAGVKGLSIALVDDQRVVWAEGFGAADDERGIRAMPDTDFRIGPLTEIFTATEILHLVQAGRLDLDRPVADYLPGFHLHNRFAGSAPITVRALLAHHSGLPGDYLYGKWGAQRLSLSALMTALGQDSLASAPQTQYKDSTLDYDVLGRIIEKLRGMPYVQAIRQDLLEPLDLRGGFTPPDNSARGYWEETAADTPQVRDLPADGLYASALDLARYLRFFFAGGSASGRQVLSAAQLDQMVQPQFADLPLDFGRRVGLGLQLGGVAVAHAGPVAWRSGNIGPFEATLQILPREKLGVVILANTNTASQFLTHVGVAALRLAHETKFGLVHRRPAKARPRKVRHLSGDALTRYAGNYVMFNQLTRIDRKGGLLGVTVHGSYFALVPVDSDTFIPQTRVLGTFPLALGDLSVRFASVHGQKVAVLRGLPEPIPFARIPSYEISEAWRRRLGTYRCVTPDLVTSLQRLRLEDDNGVLVANVQVIGELTQEQPVSLRVPLRPISDTVAVVAGLGNHEGGVVRVSTNGGQPQLYYSGFRFRRADAP